jgi:hypothetical protein
MARGFLLLVLAVFLWPVPAVAVEDPDAHRTVARIVLLPDRTVALRYRHSLYGGRVWEHLAVEGTGFVLTALEAEHEAALEYYGLRGRIVHRNGRAALVGLHVPVGAPVVRATALGERTLIAGGKTIPLTSWGDGGRVRLRPDFMPLGEAAWNALRRALPWPRR